MTKKIRVLIVDDHLVVRKGLHYVIDTTDDIHVVGDAESGEEAIFLNKKLRPDVILMDIKMDGVDGLEATSLIKKHDDNIKIIALSTFFDADVINAMRDAGAKGYLEKSVSSVELSDAIRRVHNGELVFASALPETNTKSTAGVDMSLDELGELGDQQKKVLALMTKGLTNPEIGAHLGISISTARYHVSAIFRKLDVSNRSEAVARAIQLNLVNESDI